MLRANRYVLPGRIYHLTHRCHDRQFLFRFAKDRDGYRRRLREAIESVGASLLIAVRGPRSVRKFERTESVNSVGIASRPEVVAS
jgi:REP element-mobilizing transposase RayT